MTMPAVHATTPPTLNFLVAGVPVHLHGVHNGATITESLLRFAVSGKVGHEKGIELFLEEGLPKDRPGGTLVRNGATAAIMAPDRLWLKILGGNKEAVADQELSNWRCWTNFGDYAIEMWLHLALWGYLSLRGGTLLHGAVCVFEGWHVLFLGDSGVGKSTLSGLVLEAGGACLTDEYPFVTLGNGVRPLVHGSPRPGVKGPPVPLSVPLDAVFFLRHAPANEIRRITPAASGRRLLGNARFFHWLPATIPETVNTLDKIARQVPAYDFGFVPDATAIDHLCRGLDAL